MKIYGKDNCSYAADLTNIEGQMSCLNSYLKIIVRLWGISAEYYVFLHKYKLRNSTAVKFVKMDLMWYIKDVCNKNNYN